MAVDEAVTQSIDGWLDWYCNDFRPNFSKLIEITGSVSGGEAKLSEQQTTDVGEAMKTILGNLGSLN